MSGSNRKVQVEPLPGPAFILVEPQMGENIGAAARAMWNFGLAEMRIVNPRDDWPNERAVAMASGATRVIDAARVFETRAEACADLTTVYATTARPREMTKTVFTPEAAVLDMAKRMAAGEKPGILFGRERTGLENEDVVASNAIITVDCNPAFSSLNLGQCVLLMAYEWRRASVPAEGEVYAAGDGPMASAEDVERLNAHLVEELDAANYFWPEHKREAMAASLRNLLARTPLTEQDVRMMRGVIRALAEKPRKRG